MIYSGEKLYKMSFVEIGAVHGDVEEFIIASKMQAIITDKEGTNDEVLYTNKKTFTGDKFEGLSLEEIELNYFNNEVNCIENFIKQQFEKFNKDFSMQVFINKRDKSPVKLESPDESESF